jgi:hypothetical protein
MDEKQVTHAIDLIGGCKDAKGVVHRHVVFGKRVSAKRLFQIGDDPQSSIRTQYNDLELAEMIVEFGTLKMPLSLTTLLDLDTIDRDDVREAGNVFSLQSLGDRKYEFAPDKKKMTLAFGIKVGELRYQVIEFAKRLTGRDEVAADNLSLEGLKRRAFLAGRMVGRISTADGAAAIDGPVELDLIDSEHFDGDDFFALVSASELWRQTFRLSGGKVPDDGTETTGDAAGAQVLMDRGPDSGAAAGAA